jgi:hypothetical protein
MVFLSVSPVDAMGPKDLRVLSDHRARWRTDTEGAGEHLYHDYQRVPRPDGTFEVRTPHRKV